MTLKNAHSLLLQDVHVLEVEHDVQIKLPSAFGDAVSRRRSAAEIEEIFEQLMDYTNVHFLSEQLLMRMCAYPDYEQHEQRHTQLIDRLDTRRGSLTDGDREHTLATVPCLRDAIVGHIEQDDAALARYLQRNPATHR